MKKTIKVTCLVRKELINQKKNLNKIKWNLLQNKLKKEYCAYSNCFLCPYLKLYN